MYLNLRLTWVFKMDGHLPFSHQVLEGYNSVGMVPVFHEESQRTNTTNYEDIAENEHFLNTPCDQSDLNHIQRVSFIYLFIYLLYRYWKWRLKVPYP